MDRDELIFNEYKSYCEQKENFIDRNFSTNKFYITAVVVLIFAMIYTSNVVFLDKISATLVFALLGVSVSALWWMNVDSYNGKQIDCYPFFGDWQLICLPFYFVKEKIKPVIPPVTGAWPTPCPRQPP